MMIYTFSSNYFYYQEVIVQGFEMKTTAEPSSVTWNEFCSQPQKYEGCGLKGGGPDPEASLYQVCHSLCLSEDLPIIL